MTGKRLKLYQSTQMLRHCATGAALIATLVMAAAVSARDLLPANDPFVGIVLPVDTSPSADAASKLRAVHHSLLAWSARQGSLLSSAERERLSSALLNLRQARADYGSETRWLELFDVLQRANDSLALVAIGASHPGHAFVQQKRLELSLAAREIAAQLHRMAGRAGASASQLQKIQSLLDAGDLALTYGNHNLALHRFSGASDFAANVATFDIDLFEQELRNRMQNQAVGYSYAIVRNGLLYSADGEGIARKGNPRNTSQSAYKPMYIASISKTISSLTMLRTLQLTGISLDASISGYLPSYWTQGNNIGMITFRHLMSHRSGLDVGVGGGQSGGVSGQSVQTLRNVIAAGIIPGNLLGEDLATPYVNANFALLRVLVPIMIYGEGFHTAQMDVAKSNEDEVYTASFSDLASVLVLEPTGMAPTACQPRESLSKQTLYYNINNNNAADLLDHAISGNHQRVCGATGFYLSAVELAGVLAHLRHSNHILDASMRTQMNFSSLGWLNPESFAGALNGDFGSYRAHGGDSSNDNTAAGVATCMMDYPIQVQAVLLINSRGGPGGSGTCALLRDAYDASWVAP